MGRINTRKRGKVYEYFFEGAKVNNKRTRISKSGFRTKESLRNYQKVIKSSLRDAANYFGFIDGNPAGDLQIPRVLSFEPKKT